jgi:hypothetical protein
MTHLGVGAAVVVILMSIYAFILMATKEHWREHFRPWMQIAFGIALGLMLGSFRYF